MRHADDASYAGDCRRAFFCSSSRETPSYPPSNALPPTFRALPPKPSPFRTPPQLVPQLVVSSPPAFRYPRTPFPALQPFTPRIPSIQTLPTSIPLSRTSPARFPAVPRLEYRAYPATPLRASKRMKCDITTHIPSPFSAFPDPAATDPLLSGGVRLGGHQSVYSTEHNSHDSLLAQPHIHVPLNRTYVVSTSPFSVHQTTLATSLPSQENLRCFSGTAYNCNMPSVKLKQNKKANQKKKKKKLKGKLLKQEELVREADRVNESEQKKSETREYNTVSAKVQIVSTPDGSKEKKSDLAPENIAQDEILQNGPKQRKLEASPVNTMQEEAKPDISEEPESLAEILMLQVPKRKEPKQKKLKPKKVKNESYYCKSMVVDPWQHLKLVVGNILEPLAGRMSWLPESLTADKEKATPGSNFQFNFNSTESSLFDIFDNCVQEVLES